MQGNKSVASSIVHYLNKQSKSLNEEDKESLQVAMQCICHVFDLDEDSVLKAPMPFDLSAPLSVVTNNNLEKAEELKKAGNEKLAQKKFEEAVECYTQAIALNPNSAVYYCNRAAANTMLGNNESSVKDCLKSLELDSSYVKAHSRLGKSYAALGDSENALASYKKALEFDPENTELIQNVAKFESKGSIPLTNGLPDLSKMMSDPNFMSMASNLMNSGAFNGMMENPDFGDMAKKFMDFQQKKQ